MSQKELKNRIAIAAGTVLCSAVVFGNAALGNPNNISGTWDVEANQHTGTLTLDSSGGNLSGSIFDQSIEGFYVPDSRRIVFVRKSQGIPYQFYHGRVSSSGQEITGLFHAWNSVGGASESVK